MFRLVNLTFRGEKRFNQQHVHPHEASQIMTVPLIILAVLSVIGGFVGIPHASVIEQWLEPIFASTRYKLLAGEQEGEILEYIVMVFSVGVALIGMYIARWIYLQRKDIAKLIVQRYPRIYRWLVNKYFIDEVYDAVIVNPVVNISKHYIWEGVDVSLIDGIVNGTAKMISAIAQLMRKFQTGVVQFYAVIFVGGILVIVTWLLIK